MKLAARPVAALPVRLARLGGALAPARLEHVGGLVHGGVGAAFLDGDGVGVLDGGGGGEAREGEERDEEDVLHVCECVGLMRFLYCRWDVIWLVGLGKELEVKTVR